jgi:glycosyltransferase involved in cell wall biosynthesis
MAWAALSGPFDGVVTHFPPLAATSGLLSRLRSERMIVAHNFNLGHLPRGLSRRCARHALGRVDRFIVHSRGEVGLYSDLFDFPADRFEFVRVHKAPLVEADVELPNRPFVYAAGSAQRDYATFVEACRVTGLPTVLVAGQMHLHRLKSVPPNIEVRTRLSLAQCNRLVRAAAIHVVPLHGTATAAGQVALVSGMIAGTPSIATRAVGTADYVEDGRTGYLVEPGDARALAHRIELLWNDAALREGMRHAASRFAEMNLSEAAGAAGLVRVLDSVVRNSSEET